MPKKPSQSKPQPQPQSEPTLEELEALEKELEEDLEEETEEEEIQDEAPGELRGIALLEVLEKLFKRPESRIDAQRALSKLSKNGQAYARHLVVSGPTGNAVAAKECGLTLAELEAAAQELEKAVRALM